MNTTIHLAGTAYVAKHTNMYVYDGWNLVAEVNHAGSLVRSYMWGTDLSGSMQGAGGVGGLLGVSYYGTATTNCFAAFDGNGNVAALVNGVDGTLTANYEYGPDFPVRESKVSGTNHCCIHFNCGKELLDPESDPSTDSFLFSGSTIDPVFQ